MAQQRMVRGHLLYETGDHVLDFANIGSGVQGEYGDSFSSP